MTILLPVSKLFSLAIAGWRRRVEHPSSKCVSIALRSTLSSNNTQLNDLNLQSAWNDSELNAAVTVLSSTARRLHIAEHAISFRIE